MGAILMEKQTKKLIINADDFGLTYGVTAGIIAAFKRGIVSSTTALAVSDHFDDAMRIARQVAPDLPIGLHLALTLRDNHPVLSPEFVPSLVDDTGNFWSQQQVFEQADPEDVYREWDAQITRFMDSGQRPDHLDSHHNVHGRDLRFLKVAVALAKKYQLPLRNASRSSETAHFLDYYDGVPTPDKIMPQFYDEQATNETLQQIFKTITTSSSEMNLFEINCHPAFLDQDLKDCSGYYEPRRREEAILTTRKIAETMVAQGILLTNYEVLN